MSGSAVVSTSFFAQHKGSETISLVQAQDPSRTFENETEMLHFAARHVYTRVKAQLMGTDEVQQDSRVAVRKDGKAEMVLDALSAWNWTD